MARKKQEPEKKKVNTDGIMGLHGSTTEQPISETLEINYMPYAMSVIVSRAILVLTATSLPPGSSYIPCTKWAC